MNQNHNIIFKKGCAVACAAMIGLSSVACGTASTKQESANETYNVEKKELKNTLTSSSFGTEDKNAEKVETVYVKAAEDGDVQHVVVSDWLKNYKGEDKLVDKTSLKNIENVKGDEKFKKNSDGTITWNADGNDIFYQGKASKDVPVNVNITYKLNGKEMSAKEIAGKSGKVSIIFNYENNAKTTVDINGKKEEVTVPFAMISGVMLPSSKFKNVTVTNGQVISDATKNIVVGAALPGLSDTLKLNKDKLNELGANSGVSIPETVEITADTTDFELGMTMTMASSNVLSELGFTGVDASGTVNQIESSMKLLQDSSNLLSNGSKTLKNGTADMKAGLKTYTNGVSQLNNGLKTLNDGMPKLAAGSKQLADGSNKLYNKLSASVFNNDSLKGLINSYSYVNAKLSASPYKDLYTTIKGMNDTKTEFAKLPDPQKMAFLNSATKAATNGQVSDYTQLPAEKKADVQNLCVLGLMISAKNGSNGSELIADFTKFGTYKNKYDQAAAALANDFNALGTNELADIDVASGKVKPNGEAWLSATGSFQQEWNKLGKAAASGDTTAATTYYAKYLAFQKKNASIGSISSSLPELQSGVAQLRDGSALLHKSIVDTLVPGVSALYNGSALLSGNSSKLNVGAAKLDEGALQLSNGMVKFNEEGIQKISGAFSGDIKELTDRIKAIDTASKEYTTFSGTTEDMSSTVKFVIETKGVRAKTK